jgi:acylphosphatase
MNKIKATVSGTIQNVGYRAKVIRIAKDFGLTGFIQNLEDGRVRIIAESKNGDFEKFLDAIRIKNTLIDVADVEVEYADATGDFADFYKLVGGGETDERLDKASDYLKKLIDVTERGFGSFNSKMDVMIEKQDVTITEIRGLREDMKTYMDRKFEEIESELDVIKSALRAREILC